jgi:hypothetical protein
VEEIMNVKTFTGMPYEILSMAAGLSTLELPLPSSGIDAEAQGAMVFGAADPAAVDDASASQDDLQRYLALTSIESPASPAGIFAKELDSKEFWFEVYWLLCDAANLRQIPSRGNDTAFGTGDSYLFIRNHLDEIRSLAAAIPSENARSSFFTWGFRSALPLIRKFGFEPFQRIVEANPERAWAIVSEIADLEELVYRVGMEPFARIATEYENAEWILRQIRGVSPGCQDADGRHYTRYDGSMAEDIRSAEDLLYYAKSINAFRKAAHRVDWSSSFPPLGSIAKRYGIASLPAIGSIVGERLLVQNRHKEHWVLTEGDEVIASRMGYDFLAELHRLAPNEDREFAAHLDEILTLYPTPQDTTAFLEGLRTLSSVAQEKVADPFQQRLFHTADGLIEGLFGHATNKVLLETLGISAFLEAFATANCAPDAEAFAFVAHLAHLVKTPDDLAAVVREYTRSSKVLRAALPSLTHLIGTFQDLKDASHTLTDLEYLFGEEHVISSVPAAAGQLRGIRDLTTALFFLDTFYHPSFVDLIRSYGLQVLLRAIAETDAATAGERRAILKALAPLSHCISTFPALIQACRMLWEKPRHVLDALPHVAHLFGSLTEAHEICETLASTETLVVTLLKHVKHLLKTPDDIRKVLLVLAEYPGDSLRSRIARALDRVTATHPGDFLLSRVAGDIHSIEDLAEFIATVRRISNCVIEAKHRAPDVGSLTESLNGVETRAELRAWFPIRKKGFVPTAFLMRQLAMAANQEATLAEWQRTTASFAQGKFDATNELHRNLEYTRFRRIVDHEKVRKHLKNHFTFEGYERIFAKPSGEAEPLSEKDRFEIECVAHEARLLHGFIRDVAVRAKELGRPVVVVPNLSYGYLPVAPLVSGLKSEGIEVAIGMKVGSTESHENKEVLSGTLFKGHRTRILSEQPILVVVDGTQHLVSRGGGGKDARYPDAYQGYLNQVIAINDAFGFTDADYSSAGKDADDLAQLRGTEEFRKLVGIFKEIIEKRGLTAKAPYAFHLWNTARLDLTIRGGREELAKSPPIDPATLSGPAVVFANVGILDDQVPEEIRARYPGQEHQPAYFDDSGRILDFDFGHNKYGIQYLNGLEDAMKQAYGVGVSDTAKPPAFLAKLLKAARRFHSSPDESLLASAATYAGAK